jgi:ribosomal-protein-alanine N-acetyltransferase
VVYRRMVEKDVFRVHEIEQSLFIDPWPVKHFLRDIQNNEQAYPYILKVNNELVAYSICWYYAQEIHIGSIAVAKVHQGKGYGKFMLENIIKMFKEYKYAYLEVRATNKIAISLYKKFNFNILYQRRNYYANGEDALVMVRYRAQAK